MTSTLAGSTVIITGAGQGLGRAIASNLGAAGAHVIAVARSHDKVADVAESIEREGGRATARTCDVTDPDAVHDLFAWTIASLGAVQGVVNNAGISMEGAAIDRTPEDFRRLLDVNVIAPMSVAQAAARAMATGGSIVNVASAAGLSTMPGLVHYGASKAALVHMTRALAVEWARHGIRVNAIAPGIVPTSLNEAALADQALKTLLERRIPLRAFGDADQVAEAVRYLLSPAASYITGTVLPIDGGVSAAGGR